MVAGALLTCIALAVVLYAESRRSARLQRIAKPLASTGFLIVALAAGAMDSTYGQLVLAALACSWLGDVALLSRHRIGFLAGLSAFFAAHVAFATAFISRGLALPTLALALLGLAIPAWFVRRWLVPYVPTGLRRPVDAYIGIITIMVATAVSTASPAGRIVAGAIAFYLSDLSVAHDRFVRESLGNRLWGLPMYYLAQLLLATTVGGG